MISIYINNQLADYFGDITIKKDNPLFSSFDVEPTEHTYTLTLPTTATNAKIFSLIQHTFATSKKLPARIEIDGVVVLEGSCNVQLWSDSGYSVYFSGIAPYEDTNISPIKKMLGDTTILPVILNKMLGFDNFVSEKNYEGGAVFLQYKGIDAIARADNAEFAYKAIDSSISVVSSFQKTNFIFSAYFLINAIADYYGIKATIPKELQDVWLYTFDSPEFLDSEDPISPNTYRLSSSAPMWTPKELIINVATAISDKIHFDFNNNKMTFFDLVGYSKMANNNIDTLSYSINFDKTAKIQGVVEFANFDIKEDGGEDGEPIYIKFSNNDYTYDIGYTEGEESKIYYTNKAGVAYFNNGNIIVPTPHYNNEYYQELKGKVVFLGALFYGYAPSTELETIYNGDPFMLYEDVTKRPIVNLKSSINPLQFISMDYWKPVFIDNIGNIYIKSISFKSNGESDIEGYLI
jgi:hypothetical protein